MSKTQSLRTELRQLRTKRPFRPFRVVMKSGKQFSIGQRLWFAFGGNTLVLMPGGGPTQIFKFDEVDSVEVLKKKH